MSLYHFELQEPEVEVVVYHFELFESEVEPEVNGSFTILSSLLSAPRA